MKKNGFSLVTILIVIVVVVIVAAVCYPIFLKSKDKEKEATCLANMKKIADAFLAYTADYNETLPVAPLGEGLMLPTFGELYCGHSVPTSSNLVNAKVASIRAQLEPYTKNKEVFICPSDEDVSLEYEVNKRFTSYHYRFFIGAKTTDSEYPGPWTKSMIMFPARVFVFNDFLPFHQGKKAPDAKVGDDMLWQWTSDSKFNMVFVDGHVSIHPASHSMAWNEGNKRFDYHWPRMSEQPPWTSTKKLWDLD